MGEPAANLEERRASAGRRWGCFPPAPPPQCGHRSVATAGTKPRSGRSHQPTHPRAGSSSFRPALGSSPRGRAGLSAGGPWGGGPRLLQPQGPHPLTRPWGLRGKYLRVTLREDAHDRGDRSRAPCTDSSPVATRISPWRSACPWSMVTGGPGWGPRVISPPHTFLLSGGRPRLRHGAAGAGGGRMADPRLPYSLDQRAVLPECLLQDHGQGARDMAAGGFTHLLAVEQKHSGWTDGERGKRGYNGRVDRRTHRFPDSG